MNTTDKPMTDDEVFVISPAPIEADDFPLPAACPMRNEGDDICESCQ